MGQGRPGKKPFGGKKARIFFGKGLDFYLKPFTGRELLRREAQKKDPCGPLKTG